MLGHRVTQANIQKHNGTLDEGGQPTYWNDADWDVIVSDWPCQFDDKRGTETTRGRQATSVQNFEFLGDPYPLIQKSVDTTCRLVADGITYGILAIRGLEPMSLEATIEAGVEN